MTDSDDLAAIRAAAERLGMPAHDPRHSMSIESADDFVTRMRRQDNTPAATQPGLAWIRNHRTQLIGAVAACTALLGMIGVVGPWGGSSALAQTPPMLTYGFADAGEVAYAPGHPAGSSLRKLSQIAGQDKSSPGSLGSVQHVQTSGWYAQLDSRASSKSAQVVPTVRDVWLESDGSLLTEERRGNPLTIDGRVDGISAETPDRRETIPPNTFDPTRASSVGSNPAEVRAKLLRHAQCENKGAATTTACLYREIVGLNENWVIPGALTSAFWTILSEQRDIRSLGTVTDRAGRPGIGFAIDLGGSPKIRRILIIDSQNGRLIGIEDVLTKDDTDTQVDAPAVYAFTAILKSEWSRRP